MKTKTGIRIHLLCGLLVTTVLLFNGCQLMNQAGYIPQGETPPEHIQRQTLMQGKEAFRAGDYARAREIFNDLALGDDDEETRRRALYGFVCSSLLLAENQEKMQEAMRNWELLTKLSDDGGCLEDPGMLTPVLERYASCVLRSPLEEAEEEARQGKNRELDKELKSCKVRLQAKEAEIEKLKQQLEALENIHREIDQKKKQISS